MAKKIVITHDMSAGDVKKMYEQAIVGTDVLDLPQIIGQKYHIYYKPSDVANIHVRFQTRKFPPFEVVYIIPVRYENGKAVEVKDVIRQHFGP